MGIVAVLWTAFFLVNFNIAMMIPLLPFVQAALGLTTPEAGWVLAVFPLTALAANLAIGPWIDRLGRRRFLAIGGATCTAVFLLTALASGAGTLILCRALIGLAMPMIGASIFAAMADYVPADRRARANGIVATAAPIAFLLSMSLGVVLGGLVSWQAPILLAAGLAGAVGLGAVALLPPTPREALLDGPITPATYRNRLLSLSLSADTRRLFLGYFGWSAAVFTFLGLYPGWIVQRGLPQDGPGMIGTLLLLGEVGGLLGAVLSARAARLVGRPLGACALAAFATAAVVAAVPLGAGSREFQALAYGGFAFGRDLMLALILGGAMLLVPAAQRGSLNAILNAIYQSGATAGGLASAFLYALRPDFAANAGASAALFVVSGFFLWRITRHSG